jgi:GntR family transcriptional regulator, transcriptional repressor for pyruvate dehydrogenase complex
VNEKVKDSKNGSKIYVEIVKQIREMISNDGLISGDKIPSERELSERLNVGRSSVREALRALELLGLIETRRGEGTFIRDFKGNQLVQLLSTFILQDEKAKQDVIETKYFIEMDCLRLVLKKMQFPNLSALEKMLETDIIDDDQFFHHIVLLAENHLFSRIWIILKDYYRSLSIKDIQFSKRDYQDIISALYEGNQEKTLNSYQKLREMSKA